MTFDFKVLFLTIRNYNYNHNLKDINDKEIIKSIKEEFQKVLKCDDGEMKKIEII
jgi:formiminotetrahydrofolate cyclodeaminase